MKMLILKSNSSKFSAMFLKIQKHLQTAQCCASSRCHTACEGIGRFVSCFANHVWAMRNWSKQPGYRKKLAGYYASQPGFG